MTTGSSNALAAVCLSACLTLQTLNVLCAHINFRSPRVHFAAALFIRRSRDILVLNDGFILVSVYHRGYLSISRPFERKSELEL